MKTIYKYTLQPESNIDMPIGAELLSIHEQRGQICLWALVNPQNVNETRSFIVFGTGHMIPKSNMNFVGTALLEGGSLVLHVFEVNK